VKKLLTQYASRDKKDQQFRVTSDEICQFLGIILLSGYHALPQESDYWSTQPDLVVSVVYQTMSSKWFQAIKRYLHLVDNQQLPVGDKTGKTAPLVAAPYQNLVQFGIFHRNLSIDESMTVWRCSFVASWCIGFKRWCLCGTNGYPMPWSSIQVEKLKVIVSSHSAQE